MDKELNQALINAFPTKSALRQMVQYSFNENLETIVENGSLKDIVFELIQKFKAEDRVLELVQGAMRENSTKQLKGLLESLLALAEQPNGSKFIATEQNVEYKNKSVNKNGSTTDEPVANVSGNEEVFTIELKINRPYDKYSWQEQQALLKAIHNLLDTGENIKIVGKRRGSVIITLQGPPKKIQQLRDSILNGEFPSNKFDIVEVVSVGQIPVPSTEIQDTNEESIELNGKEYEKLVQALISAFPTKMELAKMLRHRLSESLEVISGDNNLEDITFKLVQKFEAEDRIPELVKSAREGNPYNQALRNLK